MPNKEGLRIQLHTQDRAGYNTGLLHHCGVLCPPPPSGQQVGCTCDYLAVNESHFVVARPLYYVPNFGSSSPTPPPTDPSHQNSRGVPGLRPRTVRQ